MTAEIANGTMTETLPAVKSRIDGDVAPNGKKSSWENERCRRRKKQKKNKNPTPSSADGNDRTPPDDSEGDAAEDGKEISDPLQGDDKQDENAQTEALKKKANLDSDEEDLDTPQKEKGGLRVQLGSGYTGFY